MSPYDLITKVGEELGRKYLDSIIKTVNGRAYAIVITKPESGGNPYSLLNRSDFAEEEWEYLNRLYNNQYVFDLVVYECADGKVVGRGENFYGISYLLEDAEVIINSCEAKVFNQGVVKQQILNSDW